MKPKVRFIPVIKAGKGHEGHVDGWIIDPETKPVHDEPVKKPKGVTK